MPSADKPNTRPLCWTPCRVPNASLLALPALPCNLVVIKTRTFPASKVQAILMISNPAHWIASAICECCLGKS